MCGMEMPCSLLAERQTTDGSSQWSERCPYHIDRSKVACTSEFRRAQPVGHHPCHSLLSGSNIPLLQMSIETSATCQTLLDFAPIQCVKSSTLLLDLPHWAIVPKSGRKAATRRRSSCPCAVITTGLTPQGTRVLTTQNRGRRHEGP